MDNRKKNYIIYYTITDGRKIKGEQNIYEYTLCQIQKKRMKWKKSEKVNIKYLKKNTGSKRKKP